jgi:hypothetical protein
VYIESLSRSSSAHTFISVANFFFLNNEIALPIAFSMFAMFILQQSQPAKPSPECVGDIQSEIRTWVIKKGIGETTLHRAARLGYTVR